MSLDQSQVEVLPQKLTAHLDQMSVELQVKVLIVHRDQAMTIDRVKEQRVLQDQAMIDDQKEIIVRLRRVEVAVIGQVSDQERELQERHLTIVGLPEVQGLQWAHLEVVPDLVWDLPEVAVPEVLDHLCDLAEVQVLEVQGQ